MRSFLCYRYRPAALDPRYPLPVPWPRRPLSAVQADVQDLLARHGEEGAARLDFPAFRRLVVDMLQQRSVADDHRRAFQLFDVMGQGAWGGLRDSGGREA